MILEDFCLIEPNFWVWSIFLHNLLIFYQLFSWICHIEFNFLKITLLEFFFQQNHDLYFYSLNSFTSLWYLLILWLSFFWRSRTSAIESSSGSCFMRISSASSFSNFSASSRSSSRLRISSIKSFDYGFDLVLFSAQRRLICEETETCKVAVSIFLKLRNCNFMKTSWILFQWQITLFCRRRAFKL